MLIMDARPQLEVKGINVDNLSPDGKVFFLEEGHKYYHADDIKGGAIVPFEESKHVFRSPTGILADFKEKFETERIARKYVIDHKLDIDWEQLVSQWEEKGRVASEEGTLLHGYAESMFNEWGMEQPEAAKADFVNVLYKELIDRHLLAKTELLIYSPTLRLAGQVDLLMKNEDSSEYYLYDYKFIKKPLDKKSFYNPRTKKYKLMSGPFLFMFDCNLAHYSIQTEIYRYLMGSVGKKVVKKALIVVTPDDYEIVDGLQMKIWVDNAGILHAAYKNRWGKLYSSAKDKRYLNKPYKLI